MRAGGINTFSGTKTGTHAAHGLFRLADGLVLRRTHRLIRMTDAQSHSTRYGYDDRAT